MIVPLETPSNANVTLDRQSWKQDIYIKNAIIFKEYDIKNNHLPLAVYWLGQ